MESGTSYQSLFRLQNILRKIIFSVICLLDNFNDLTQSSFCVILKITFVALPKPIHDIIIITPFESGKCGKDGEKHKNLNISRMKRAF